MSGELTQSRIHSEISNVTHSFFFGALVLKQLLFGPSNAGFEIHVTSDAVQGRIILHTKTSLTESSNTKRRRKLVFSCWPCNDLARNLFVRIFINIRVSFPSVSFDVVIAEPGEKCSPWSVPLLTSTADNVSLSNWIDLGAAKLSPSLQDQRDEDSSRL